MPVVHHQAYVVAAQGVGRRSKALEAVLQEQQRQQRCLKRLDMFRAWQGAGMELAGLAMQHKKKEDTSAAVGGALSKQDSI